MSQERVISCTDEAWSAPSVRLPSIGWRRLRGLTLAALAATGLAASSALAQVVNHGFEGTTHGWQQRGSVTLTSSDEAAHSGTSSLKTTGRTATWNGPALDLRSILTADASYQFTGWVRLVAGQPATNLKFTVEHLPSGGSTAYTQVASAAVTDGEWVRLQGNFSFTTPTNTTLLVYLEADDPTSQYYLDDFQITTVTAPGCPEPLDQSGLESDFETGSTEGWGPRGPANVAVTTADAATGTYSLAVTNREQSWQGASINALCKMHKGSKYFIALRARLLPGEGSAVMRVSLQARLNGADSYHTVIGNTTVTDAGWVDLQTEYTFGLDVEALQLYVETDSGTASFYIDDFLLVHLPPVPIEQDIPSLQDVLEPYFPIGAAIEPVELVGQHGELLLKHFNLVVAGNVMKWSSLQPTEGNFNFAPADAIADFARANGLRMRGHTLLWHSQNPGWLFLDADGNALQPGNPAHRELLLQRLRTHIHTVVARYGDIIDSWDVVNEVIDPNQPDGLRDTPWLQIVGPDYIDKAFEYAAEVAGDTALVLNDYNTNEPAKRAALANLAQGLRNRGLRVDAIGHQMHINVEWPSLANIRETIQLFTDLGFDNEITEMDMSVYTNSTDTAPVSDEVLIQQGYRYRDIFNLYREMSDQITSVTLWGMSDDTSWLKTFPITRDDKPLLFDEQLQSKPAYWGVVDPSLLPVIPQELNVTEGRPRINGVNDPVWLALAAQPLRAGDDTPSWASFKALWSGDRLHLLVDVEDRMRKGGDQVEVFLGDTVVYSFTGYGRQKSPGGADGMLLPTLKGYRLEASLPVGLDLMVGDELRFDVRITEQDGRQLSWSDTHHEQHVDRDRLGTLRLLPSKQIEAVGRGTPVVDGQLDRVWRKGARISTQRFVTGSGATADVRLLWDAGHLYVYAHVTDPVLSAASANPWEQDSIEIFLDRNNAQTTTYQPDDAQYRISFENQVTVGSTATAGEVVSATREVADGYVIEASIALGTDPGRWGAFIGFDIQVNDDGDGSGVRSSVATWNDLSGLAYLDPSQFGALYLH